jgi:hypothetical protein
MDPRTMRLCGRAFTIRMIPAETPAGSVGDYIDDVKPGQVVVLDNQGRQNATVWGDILTAIANRMGVAGTGERALQPMSFGAAAMFQFANPKAWVMAITGASAFMPLLHKHAGWLAILIYCLVFCAINLPCVSVWAGAGAVLRRYLERPLWRIGFAATMVVLTLYSALAIWL